MRKDLPIPSVVQNDENAIELIRAWAASGRQQISIATEVWENPAAWGIMLVDMARHIARSYSQSKSYEYEKTLALIKQGFDAEWSSPTE